MTSRETLFTHLSNDPTYPASAPAVKLFNGPLLSKQRL